MPCVRNVGVNEEGEKEEDEELTTESSLEGLLEPELAGDLGEEEEVPGMRFLMRSMSRERRRPVPALKRSMVGGGWYTG